MIDPILAIDLACRLAAVAALIGAAEQLSIRREFLPGGTLASASGSPATVRAGAVVPWLLAVQISTAVMVIAFGTTQAWSWTVLCILTGAFIALRWFRRVGGDGAEQMVAIILVAGCVAAIAFPDPIRPLLAIAFVTCQAVLSYTTSGIAKLVSPVWRSGEAIPAILSTIAHGTPALATWFSRHRRLAFLVCWGTIVFECAFVLALFAPLTAPILVVGLLFHLSCAVFMGLNGFLWAFPATFPCVIVAATGLAAGVRLW